MARHVGKFCASKLTQEHRVGVDPLIPARKRPQERRLGMEGENLSGYSRRSGFAID